MNEVGIWEWLALLTGGICIALYFIGAELDWWWWKKNPPKLADGFKLLLINHVPYYQSLSAANRVKFQNRVSLFFKAHEFMPMDTLATQGLHDEGGYFETTPTKPGEKKDKPVGRLPADIMLFIASSLIQLTFGLEDWLLKKTDQVVVYPKPFPTPQMPDIFHTNETFLGDKMIMFSAEQLLHYYTLGSRAYSIGLHEYANAFQQNNPSIQFPALPSDFWEVAESISGFSKSYLHEYMNLPAMDDEYAAKGKFEEVQKNEYRNAQRLNPLHVAVSLFFTHSYEFKHQLPDLHKSFVTIFNQDPARDGNPVIKS